MKCFTVARIVTATALVAMSATAGAKVSQAEADRLGKDLMPLGGEMAGNEAGTIPAWTGGYKLTGELPPRDKLRHPENYEFGVSEPEFTITADNMAQYADRITAGQKALLKKFPDTFKMPVYKTLRTVWNPDFVYEATKKNAVNAYLANDGESLVDAVTGIPFPIPQSGKEVVWNHKTRYRGLSVRRYNTQLAVQANGAFTPYKLQEDVRFQYSYPDISPDDLDNVILYFMQITNSPPRQSGNVLLVHETMDQVKEPRRAWLYNPGQRRVRRAPNVAYDNPGNGADGLRTNDQLDMFNGATDRYTWKLVGKKEMYIPYNAVTLADSRLKYSDIAKKGHLDQDLTRYELHRVWVVEADVKPETSHIYKRRIFYVDEDSWTMAHSDIYDNRDQLWRVQEYHQVMVPWRQAIGPACSTVYDLQSNRYLAYEMSNEEPLYEDRDFELEYFRTANMRRVAAK